MERFIRPLLDQEPAPKPASSELPAMPAFRSAFATVDDFLHPDLANEMRRQVDRHFADPHLHRPDRHQVWNYWYVPGLYTYLRTSPEKVIDPGVVEAFHQGLQLWAWERLGLGNVTWPNLSLYVDGCQQTLHNDSANGRLGYVFSLTLSGRKTIGGETIVLREGDLFRGNLAQPAAGRNLFDLIEPRFNRLALFDDRMPHGVQRVDGSMDPVEGRIVLHGHISEAGPRSKGPLDAEQVKAGVEAVLAPVTAEIRQGPVLYHGPVVLKLDIEASGSVAQAEVLVDRLVRADGASASDSVERMVSLAKTLRFDAREAGSVVTVPLIFGGALANVKGF